jgi:hypothetical protein
VDKSFFKFNEEEKKYSAADFDHPHHEAGFLQAQNRQ